MTDQEIDKWVEEHISVPPEEELTEHTTVVYPKLIPALIEWGKNIAHKFYELGKKDRNFSWIEMEDFYAVFFSLSKHEDEYPPFSVKLYKEALDRYNNISK